MAVKTYSTFPKDPELDLHQQIQFSTRLKLGEKEILPHWNNTDGILSGLWKLLLVEKNTWNIITVWKFWVFRMVIWN